MPFLLVIVPDFAFDMDETYPYRAIHETIRDWGEQLDIPTTDMWPIFEGMMHEEFQIPYDGHPTPLSHQWMGEWIANAFVQRILHGDSEVSERLWTLY